MGLLGLCFYVLVCGKVPFDDQSVSVLHEKIKREMLSILLFFPENVCHCFQECWLLTPLRASLYEVCLHPWMNKGYDYKVNNYL